MDFIQRVTGMLTKPRETIKDILKEPRTEEPLVIVGAYALLMMLSSYMSSVHLGMGGNIVSLVIGLVIALISWPIATGVVHALALFLGGEGKYNPQMLNAIGYTYIIKFIPAIVGLIIIFLLPSYNLGTPAVTAGMSVDQIKELMQPYITMMEQMYFNPLFILSLVISYLGLIWSCYLGAMAVKEGDKVSGMASYIAVFVPMVIYIIFSVLGTYGSYIMLKMLYG